MLAEREHTVQQLHAALVDRAYDGTENTVRHHVNELRDAGLVEVARLEERRGGTTKDYRANTIVLSYALPAGANEAVDETAERVAPTVSSAVEILRREFGEDLDRLAGEMLPVRTAGRRSTNRTCR